MRRRMLTVPPAPGIRPILISEAGRRSSRRRRYGRQKRAARSPTRYRLRVREPRSGRPARGSEGLHCGWSGSNVHGQGRLPDRNSSRSPPVQKQRPAPERIALVSRVSAARRCSPSVRPSRIAIENALWSSGLLRIRFRMSPSRVIKTAGRGTGGFWSVPVPSDGRGSRRFPGGSRRPGIPQEARSERWSVRCGATAAPGWQPPGVSLDVSDQGLCVLQVLHHHIGCVSKRCVGSSNADDRARERAQVIPEVCRVRSVHVQKNERHLMEWGKRFPPAGRRQAVHKIGATDRLQWTRHHTRLAAALWPPLPFCGCPKT